MSKSISANLSTDPSADLSRDLSKEIGGSFEKPIFVYEPDEQGGVIKKNTTSKVLRFLVRQNDLSEDKDVQSIGTLEGRTTVTVGDFCALFQEERHRAIVGYIERARQGEQVIAFETLTAGQTRLLILEASLGVTVLVKMIDVAEIDVPEHLASRVLGMRGAAIHQICNDLSAARLNSELAEKILQGSNETADERVLDALQSVVRLSAMVEMQIRDLQQKIKLNFPGTIDE